MKITQRTVTPYSIKARNIGDAIFVDDVEEGTVSVLNLPDGTEFTVTYTLTHNLEIEIFGVNYISIYIGSIADANRLPGGSSIDESQWDVRLPRFDLRRWDLLDNNDYIEVSQVYVRNETGSNQNVILKNKWKYISPRKITA